MPPWSDLQDLFRRPHCPPHVTFVSYILIAMLWDTGDCYRCRCTLKPNSLIYILQLKIIHFPSCMSVGQRVGPGRRFWSVFEVCSPSNVSLYTGLLPFRHSFCSCPRTLPALSCSLRLAHKSLWRIFNSFDSLLSVHFRRSYKSQS